MAIPVELHMGGLPLVDETNKLEDLSGITTKSGDNPYSAFIEACKNDCNEIQRLYAAHRTKRNEQQNAKFLSPNFTELIIDQHLLKLETQPAFRDERNCLTLWGRPPEHVLRLTAKLQDVLKAQAPGIWLMPLHRMHLTVLEIAFCRTPQEIGALVQTLGPALPSITSYTRWNRARLVRPMISHDLSAFAVSFLPASGEPIISPPATQPDISEGVTQEDAYTYHHLREDIFSLVQGSGVEISSRYQVPSAHITLGRFLTHEDHDTPEKREAWLQTIDRLNDWLEKEIWNQADAEYVGEWIVGQERGLDARNGTLWYGGGRTILGGQGF